MNLGLEVAAGAIVAGTPILFAALGESFAESAGVVNLGTEGLDAGRRPDGLRRGRGPAATPGWACWPAVSPVACSPSCSRGLS